MFRAISKLLSLTTIVTIGILGILWYRHSTAIDRQTAELMTENQQLHDVVTRLTDEHRVAEMLMTDQKIVNGIPQTTLLFVEYARNKSTLPPKIFTIQGNQVHLDAMVIKFDRDFVKQNDPLRGHSIALFTKFLAITSRRIMASLSIHRGKFPAITRGLIRALTNMNRGFGKISGS